MELSKRFIEQPNFELQYIYRSLNIIAKESDFIQAQLYENSKLYAKRKDTILYYDCTNYFFEIEKDENFSSFYNTVFFKERQMVENGFEQKITVTVKNPSIFQLG